MDGLTQFCAVYLIIVPILATIYLISRQDKNHKKEYVYLLVLAGVLALVLATLAGKLIENPRPYISDGVSPLFYTGDDNGFPSSHTLLAGTLAFVALVYSRRLGVAMLVIATIIGWARVEAGVHHGVDVAGSLLIAGISVWIALKLIQTWHKEKQEEAPKKNNNHA